MRILCLQSRFARPHSKPPCSCSASASRVIRKKEKTVKDKEEKGMTRFRVSELTLKRICGGPAYTRSS